MPVYQTSSSVKTPNEQNKITFADLSHNPKRLLTFSTIFRLFAFKPLPEMPIYIVDEDLSVSKGLARLFQASGHEVSVFDSADELLGSVGTDLYGCIILDSRLPGLSGAEMVSRLRKDGCHIPVIVISGDDDQATRRIAKKMGAVGFFRKPVDGIALLDAVNWQLKLINPFSRPSLDP